MRVHTEAIQFKADQKLIALVEQKLAKMEQLFDKIILANVRLKLENSGQVRDKIVEVRLSVPGEVIIASETNKTFEASVDQVIGALKKQLIKYKERLRKK